MTVPDCSPCGLAVEWARSCYKGRWRLFANAPEIETEGQYYFCPPDTPFVRGATHFYSRDWFDANWETENILGPVQGIPQPWYRGDPPAILPINRMIGDSRCFAVGGNINTAKHTEEMENGFIKECFLPATDENTLWDNASLYSGCSIQFFYATIIKWMYEQRPANITTAFQLLLGNAITVNWHIGTDLYPDVVIVTHADFTIIVADGTQTYTQWAYQAFYGIQQPIDYGVIGTLPLWYDASTWIHNFTIADGVDQTKPLFVVGHSYGGAAVVTLAARYLANAPKREIRRLTYGAPKPGDGRMQTLLSVAAGISLVNETDLVPALCPDALGIFAVAEFLGLPSLFNWARWFLESNRALMDLNGNLTFNQSPILDFPTLLRLTNLILAFQPLTLLGPHSIEDYLHRIELRCPFPEWPVSVALWRYLHGFLTPHVGLGIGARLQFAGLELGCVVPAPIIVFLSTLEIGISVARPVIIDSTLELGWSTSPPIVPDFGLSLGTSIIFAGVEIGIEMVSPTTNQTGLEIGIAVPAPGSFAYGLELGTGVPAPIVSVATGIEIGIRCGPEIPIAGLEIGTEIAPAIIDNAGSLTCTETPNMEVDTWYRTSVAALDAAYFRLADVADSSWTLEVSGFTGFFSICSLCIGNCGLGIFITDVYVQNSDGQATAGPIIVGLFHLYVRINTDHDVTLVWRLTRIP